MALTLPLASQEWPLFRLLTRPKWDGHEDTPWTSNTAAGAAAWDVQPMEGGTDGQTKTDGFYLIEFDRVCLPFVGRASFGYRYGRITEVNVGTPADLTGYEVRIQAAPRSSPTAWRTVWVGTVETQEDRGWPGAVTRSGERVYHCADSLFRLSRCVMDRHGVAVSDEGAEALVGNTRGHPGYNTAKARDGRVAGNQWSDTNDKWTPLAGGTDYPVAPRYHTAAGSSFAIPWTDQQAIEHAQATTRRPGEPFFPLVSGTGDWDGVTFASIDRLDGTSAWEARKGASTLDFLHRVLKRERGKGLAFLDWNDDSLSPGGGLTVFLRVWPQHYDDIEYDDPVTLAPVVIAGSYNAGTNAGNVDLIGDHRVVDDAFVLGDKDQYLYDAVESHGEPIEVLATLSFVDDPTGSAPDIEGHTLRRGWSADDQDTFRTRQLGKRVDERFRPVYQAYRLPTAWDFNCGNGNDGSMYRIDYRCLGDDVIAGLSSPRFNGYIMGDDDLTGGLGGSAYIEDTSSLLVEIMDDLPLYDVYDYTTDTPVRWDTGDQDTEPKRRPAFALLRVLADKYTKVESLAPQMQIKIDKNTIWLYDHSGNGNGVRLISDPSHSSLNAIPTNGSYTKLSFTVGLRLPHAVRLYSGLKQDDTDCRRKATIYHPDHHLWLAHPGAIWELDGSAGSDAAGRSPRRAAAGATGDEPGILRDDRSALALLHYTAVGWYMTARRTAAWALRAFGLFPSFEAYTGIGISGGLSSFTYAKIGQVVDQLSANGDTHAIKTPVTRVHYDNLKGITSWSTDWSELEFEK